MIKASTETIGRSSPFLKIKNTEDCVKVYGLNPGLNSIGANGMYQVRIVNEGPHKFLGTLKVDHAASLYRLTPKDFIATSVIRNEEVLLKPKNVNSENCFYLLHDSDVIELSEYTFKFLLLSENSQDSNLLTENSSSQGGRRIVFGSDAVLRSDNCQDPAEIENNKGTEKVKYSAYLKLVRSRTKRFNNFQEPTYNVGPFFSQNSSLEIRGRIPTSSQSDNLSKTDRLVLSQNQLESKKGGTFDASSVWKCQVCLTDIPLIVKSCKYCSRNGFSNCRIIDIPRSNLDFKYDSMEIDGLISSKRKRYQSHINAKSQIYASEMGKSESVMSSALSECTITTDDTRVKRPAAAIHKKTFRGDGTQGAPFILYSDSEDEMRCENETVESSSTEDRAELQNEKQCKNLSTSSHLKQIFKKEENRSGILNLKNPIKEESLKYLDDLPAPRNVSVPKTDLRVENLCMILQRNWKNNIAKYYDEVQFIDNAEIVNNELVEFIGSLEEMIDG